MKLIVFTDLDGTLLDSNYSYEHSLKAVNRLKEREIPIIFCSSKTRAEQEVYRKELVINDPFIVENGGAIFIPKGYFPFPLENIKVKGQFLIIEIGTSYHKIRQVIKIIQRETEIRFKGFGDMSVREVAEVTGLNLELAKRAKMRQYSETIVLMGIDDPESVLKRVKEMGLNWAYGGRYCTIIGENDKGRAMEILTKIYKRIWRDLKTVGIGDALNDLPMLFKVDMPFLVQKSEGLWENIELPHLKKVEGIGPFGWSKAIFSFT
jgi:mannosyl-3-phosphoglycerate phosphatase